MPAADPARGYLALVLHAHLPFVRHPEHEHFLEERWLYEALAESYLPLLQLCERLDAEGVRFRLTLSVSPTLVAMLDDDLLRRRFDRHLESTRLLVESERRRTTGNGHLQYLAGHSNPKTTQIYDRRRRRVTRNIVERISI